MTNNPLILVVDCVYCVTEVEGGLDRGRWTSAVFRARVRARFEEICAKKSDLLRRKLMKTDAGELVDY